jgi:hypothetical protein
MYAKPDPGEQAEGGGVVRGPQAVHAKVLRRQSPQRVRTQLPAHTARSHAEREPDRQRQVGLAPSCVPRKPNGLRLEGKSEPSCWAD